MDADDVLIDRVLSRTNGRDVHKIRNLVGCYRTLVSSVCFQPVGCIRDQNTRKAKRIEQVFVAYLAGVPIEQAEKLQNEPPEHPDHQDHGQPTEVKHSPVFIF